MAPSMMVEERQARITEIIARQQELDVEFRGMTFTDDAKTEFETLAGERVEHEAAILELEQRSAYLEEQARQPEQREDGAVFHTRRPGAVTGNDIYDLTTIRSSFADPTQARTELHDRAKRSIETAVFPNGRLRREDAQAHVEELLDGSDTRDGELARLILTTGSPRYRSQFRKYLTGQIGTDTMKEEVRAFQTSTTGIPIPYTLDPTLLPVSSSVVNPLRAISNVSQIVGSNEWRGLTAAAITASRVAAETEATDNTPTLAQPVVPTSKAHCFVPFDIEAGQDWANMDSEMARLIADAKDDEEATAFATGNGTPPNPSGVVTGATGATAASTGLTITAANLYALEAALAPRARPHAQWIANRAMYNIIRGLDTAGGAQLWVRIGDQVGNAPAAEGGNGNTGLRLLGYPVNELSTMSATVVNSTKIMILGNFQYFKIVDRVGLTIELVPHIFGATARYPIGQRGFYAYWRNGSKVLDPIGFRALTGTT